MENIKRILFPRGYFDRAPRAAWYAQFLATTHRADVHVLHIVIDARARSAAHRMSSGSTSQAVLESVTCPVLMVPVVTMAEPVPAETAGARNDG